MKKLIKMDEIEIKLEQLLEQAFRESASLKVEIFEKSKNEMLNDRIY